MKTTINKFALLFVTLVVMLGIQSCFEKDDNDYDFDSIYPIIYEVVGTDVPMQGRHYIFTATIRGGSTFTWVTAQNAEIVAISSTGNYKVHVYFPDVITSADDPEIITVTETTLGGITSDPYTYQIDSTTPFAALPIVGANTFNAGFATPYEVSPSATDTIYSTYAWGTSAGTITPSTTSPWTMSITVENEDVVYVEGKDTITLSLIEETTRGFKDTSYVDVVVTEYCPLNNGNEDLVGIWSGDDGYFDWAPHTYASQVVTSEATETGVTLYGLNFGWIVDAWGETVTNGGAINLIVNESGTVEIEYQYLFTTDYEGSPYDYWVEGSGRWNNCGTYPTLEIEYTLTNETDGYELPVAYYGSFGRGVFSASLVLDGGLP